MRLLCRWRIFPLGLSFRLESSSPVVVPTRLLTSVMASTDQQLEAAKRLAARMAVDHHVTSGMAVGVGSGSTIVYAIERLKERMLEDKLDVRCVPTSFQSRQLIIQSGLQLSDLEQTPSLDVAIDGADEADAQLTLIKGGGAALTQEKIVAAAAKDFIVVADYRKDSSQLGENWKQGVPIEVVQMAYAPVTKAIEAKFGGKANLRMGKMKAGPVVTDNGNFVLDWQFVAPGNWLDIHRCIKLIPGVVETGLFVNMAKKAYFGKADGTVVSREAPTM